MDIITKTQRYLPHTLETRYYAVKLYRSGHTVSFVSRRHKISKASLMRWNKRFDGTKESLMDLSYKAPPGSHTDEEIQHIRNYTRRNPKITMLELYWKLKLDKGYQRHTGSLFRMLRKLGYYKEELSHR